MDQHGHRDAWIEVDLDAVRANATALRSLLPAGTSFMGVIKADAYGHGAIPVAHALGTTVDAFGVATLDEGLALRTAGIDSRIVVLYEVPTRALGDALAGTLEVSVGSIGSLDATLNAIGSGATSQPAPFVHLKIDTGMTRQGIRPDEIEGARDLLGRAAPYVRGIWTHLRDGADLTGSIAQRQAFAGVVSRLAALGIHGERHVSASAAILSRSVVDEDMARPGLSLYGAVPDEFAATGLALPIELRPAMAVRAQAVRIVDVPAGTPVGYGGTFMTDVATRLATLPLGYADGIPRTLSNGRGAALVRGRRVPIVGRISMDSLVVDLSAVPSVTRSDPFTIIGPDGDDAITLEAMAADAGTIPQEVAVRLAGRLPMLHHPA
jgi:alanine racemase